ncbi:MAG: acyclic terpene utilization AtuA family protein, partial [Paracoccaceae bacterium]|nr:acyclic terpene utilization AtuA family protein [Paracoccaceae bacterium]
MAHSVTTKILIPSGALGLGYDRDALVRGVKEKPDLIAIDGGSTDSGPHYLGTGTSKYSRSSIKSEWRELMDARARAGVPLVIGTAGTSGADDATDWLVEITREIIAETGQSAKVAILKSGQANAKMVQALAGNKIKPLEPAMDVTAEVLESCTNIVALAGAEQIQAALDTGADIVIAGRTTDTAMIAALPLARGCHAGGAWHGAKIGECGALATTSPNSGTIMITFDDTGFTVEPMGDTAKATPYTVSAHMLYENSNPYQLYEPGGHLDVIKA